MFSESNLHEGELFSRDMLKKFTSASIDKIYHELYAIRTTPASMEKIIKAAEDKNNHAAYALMAMTCDDVTKLNQERLIAAVNYLKSFEVEDERKCSGIKSLINTLNIMIEYHNAGKSISMEIFRGRFGSLVSDKFKPLVILPGAHLAELNLSGRNLDLKYADFHGALLNNASFAGCKLERANFSNSVTPGVSFDKCDLSFANLSGCKLKHINFGRPFSATFKDTSILHDADRLTDETLKVFLDNCLVANIPLRTVMENLLRNMRFLGHKPKYNYTEKENLLQTFTKHALYANSDKLQDKKYCTQIIKREYENIHANLDAREAKRSPNF